MNLNQLKLFYLTARYKSPSEAAKFLNISQPAVTTGIHRMEDHYDVKLFQRDGNTMKRTEAGDALFKQAEKILEKQVIIMHEKSSAIRKALLTFIEKDNIQITTPVEYSNNEAIKRAVELKAGVALISRLVADKEIKRGELKDVPLSDPSIGRKFYLIHHKDKYIFKLLENFLETMKVWADEYDTGVEAR